MISSVSVPSADKYAKIEFLSQFFTGGISAVFCKLSRVFVNKSHSPPSVGRSGSGLILLFKTFRMSAAFSAHSAPRRKSELGPSERASPGDPGIAKISRLRSAAMRAVISEPDLPVASATSTASLRAATIRLRRGKLPLWALVPIGYSDTSNPCSPI